MLLCTAKGSSSVVQTVLLEAVDSNVLGNVVVDSLGEVKGE